MVKSTSFYQQNILNQLDKQLDIQMKEIENVSLAVSRNSNLLNYLDVPLGDNYTRFTNSSRVTFDLSNLAYSMPIIYSFHLYVTNPSSSDFQGPVKFMDIEDMKKQDWYATVKNTDFCWIGQHDINTNQGNLPVISFARKIYSPDYNYEALILLDIKASDINRIMQGEELGANRVLLDSGGRPVTFIGDLGEEDYSTIIKDLQEQQGIVLNNKGFIKYKDSLVVWSKQFSSDWSMMEITPWTVLTRGSLNMAIILLSIGIIAMVFALCITLILSKQFTKPIKLLLRSMSSFSLENKDYPMGNDYYNEFGALFKGFRVLVNRITELYDSLEIRYRLQREAEIQALQAMINPHFLYNTLDQLNWMAIDAGEERMSYVLELMGKMFRIGLSNGESLIPIRDELVHLDCYLQIQQIRWDDKLVFRIDVPESIINLYIPKLTLQPFVENSVIHGLHGQETGLIEIHAHEDREDIVFTITDNGVGLHSDWQAVKQRNTGGYGIRNVKERIKAYYGDSYGITIANNGTTGTLVTIRIPMIKDKA